MADGVCLCTMYDGGGENAAHVRCTTYDVRLPNLRALRGEAEPGRTGCLGAVIGHSYKGAGALDGRRGLPMYDVRRRRRERRPCTMYDVRCTIAIFARVARGGGGKCVWTAQMHCPEGEN